MTLSRTIFDLKKLNLHFYLFYQELAWEPNVAQRTHNYSHHLPALGRKSTHPT